MQAGVFELGNLQTCLDLKGREWRNVKPLKLNTLSGSQK